MAQRDTRPQASELPGLVLMAHKQRRPSIPDDHKKALILALRVVDEVVVGQGRELGLDFKDDFLRIRPDLLGGLMMLACIAHGLIRPLPVVTTDDKYGIIKRDLCDQVGASYIVLPKTPPLFTPTSTTEIVRNIRAPSVCPLRVDFAGGWLDGRVCVRPLDRSADTLRLVPRFAVPGAFIVNCAISPAVTLNEWPYELKSGLGGSAAWAMLNGANGVESELNLGNCETHQRAQTQTLIAEQEWDGRTLRSYRKAGCVYGKAGTRPSSRSRPTGSCFVG